jgi:hypothetical protein
MSLQQKKRRTASAERHEISRNVTDYVAGSESRLDRARFMNNAAVALDIPGAAPYDDPGSATTGPGAPKEDWASRPENRRHARLLLHYRQ